jgi:hypothetical protein
MNHQKSLQGMLGLTLAALVVVACATSATMPARPTSTPTRVPPTATLTPVRPSATLSQVLPTSTVTPVQTSQWARFDRWGLTFEYPQGWTEWSAEKLAAVKSALDAQLAQTTTGTKRTVEDVTIIATQDQEVAVIVGVLRFEGAVTAQTLLAEERSKMDAASAAGDVTKIVRIEQTTIAGKPAIIVDVERGASGRGYAVTILSGDLGIQIQCIVQNLQRFAVYEPDFNHIFQTLTIGPLSATVKGIIVDGTTNNPLAHKTVTIAFIEDNTLSIYFREGRPYPETDTDSTGSFVLQFDADYPTQTCVSGPYYLAVGFQVDSTGWSRDALWKGMDGNLVLLEVQVGQTIDLGVVKVRPPGQ